MSTLNYTTIFAVSQTPAMVFSAINNVHAWWSEGIQGNAEKPGDRFIHSVLNLHRCDLEVTEMVTDKKVVWRVIDNYFSFTKDETEWKNTDIVFEITREGDKTEVKFTHVGLVPEYECYDVCKDGWQTYISSLYALITTGTGNPNVGEAMTESEQKLVRLAS